MDAISIGEIPIPEKVAMMPPMSSSKAAELERPEPGSTSDCTKASKPRRGEGAEPRRAADLAKSAMPAAMPRTMAAELPLSSG